MTINAQQLTNMSARLGEFLQKSGVTPSEASIILMITLGRLFAREGFKNLSLESAWGYTIHEGSKVMFAMGYRLERELGHMGADE
jgi:hypothetical protein